jgi:predicted RNA-binding protein Jag
MKSILQEGSSIFKAVEQAWSTAGKPQEFTVKVLESESRNFLGITTKPAIISITYDIKSRFVRSQERVIEKSIKKQKKEKKQQLYQQTSSSVKNLKERDHVRAQKSFEKKHDTSKSKRFKGWDRELVDCSINWLNEMIRILGVKASVRYKADQRILNIYINKRLLEESEDEKMFFISLSHLLMQFLRRKYKKRFNNYYLIIHTQQSGTGIDERKKTSKSKQ